MVNLKEICAQEKCAREIYKTSVGEMSVIIC